MNTAFEKIQEVYLFTGTSSKLFKLVKQQQQPGEAAYGNTVFIAKRFYENREQATIRQ